MFIFLSKYIFSNVKSLFIFFVLIASVIIPTVQAVSNSLAIDASHINIDVNKQRGIANLGRIEANEKKITASVKDIETNEKKVKTNTKNIEINKRKVNNNKENIEINKEDIETNKGKIRANKKNVLENNKEIKTNKNGAESNKNNIMGINRTLNVVDGNLKNKAESILSNANEMKKNRSYIDTNNDEIAELGKASRANTVDIVAQKSLTEENSIRLYEILIKSSENEKTLEGLSESVEGDKVSQFSSPQNKEKRVLKGLNYLWTIVAMMLASAVLFAFVLMSTESSKQNSIQQKVVGNDAIFVWFAAFIGYFVVGFSVMYGVTASGWIGPISFSGVADESTEGLVAGRSYLEFILFQSSFSALFALLVHFMLAQRLQQLPHVLLALLVGMFVFPVLGHWVWAGNFFLGNQGWLQATGFIDIAGATIIHSAAAWFVLIIAWRLGNNEVAGQESKMDDAPLYSGLGVCLLWLALIGFNMGMLSIFSQELIKTILNITLSAGSAGMTLFLYHAFKKDSETAALPLCGFVSGLVAISAVSTMVTPSEAIVIGIVAAIVQHVAFNILKNTILKKQTRVAVLVAVHGFVGVWGTLSVALFGTDGRFGAPDLIQLNTQGTGIGAIFVYSVVFAWVVLCLFAIYRKFSRMNALLNDKTDITNESTN